MQFLDMNMERVGDHSRGYSYECLHQFDLGPISGIAVIKMCSLIGNIVSPNPACVMMATVKEHWKIFCHNDVLSEMNRLRRK